MSGLEYTDPNSALKYKEGYEDELIKRKTLEAGQHLSDKEPKSSYKSSASLQQHKENLQKLQEIKEKREKPQATLNEKSRTPIQLQSLLVDESTLLSRLDADIERLRILCQQVEGTASGVSVAGKQEDASQEDSAIEKHFEKSTNLIEHVQLVERPKPIKCITVEPGSKCCAEVVGLRLDFNDQIFIDKESTVLKEITSKRDINIGIGTLGAKLPESEDLQIISFKGSFDCISKVLAVKDKIIYLIISHNLAKSVVPLLHQHRCVQHIYVLKNIDNQKQTDWINDYPKICTGESSIDSILKLIKQDMDILLQRPSRWSRSRKLLSELSLQTEETNLWTLIEDTPKEDIKMIRIITLFFGSHPLFSQSQSSIQIDEFNDVDTCIQSIQAQNSITIFLVIFTDNLDNLHSLLQLDAIHAVYLVRKGIDNDQTEKHSKISGVFSVDRELLEQLIADICFYRHMRFHTPTINIFHLEPTFNDNIDDQQIHFLFFQLFNDILMHIPSVKETQTSDLFISQLTESNIAINHLFNHFNRLTLQESVTQLKSMNQCITSLSQKVESSPITIYRAQLVSKKDLETMQKNINALFSISNFVIASRSFRDVVDICRRAVDSQVTVVLLKLNLSENVIRANLSADTVVFKPGTVFRLTSMECAVDDVWHIQLESVNGVMQRIKDQLQSKLGGQLTWLTFGNYLTYFKKFDAAKEYYHYLLSVLSDNHSSLVSIYNNMGLIHSEMNETEEALDWLTKASSLDMKNSSDVVKKEIATPADVGLGDDLLYNRDRLLGGLADIGCRLGDQTKALDFYRRAHEIATDVNLQKLYREKILALSFVDDCQ